MSKLGIRDIVGPTMVGPSSSHTAGALRIAKMARTLCGETPKKVEYRLLGSFAHTLTGHGTDKAIVAGMLGFESDDLRIRKSFSYAKQCGLEYSFKICPDEPFDHPNTIEMQIVTQTGDDLFVRGVSIGGGAAMLTRIDDIDVELTGELNSLVIKQNDVNGVLTHICSALSINGINIASARLHRKAKGETAFTIIKTDQDIPDYVVHAIMTDEDILGVRVVPRSVASGRKTDPTIDLLEADKEFKAADFKSGSELLALCKKKKAPISQVFLDRERALSHCDGFEDDTPAYIKHVVAVMKESTEVPLDKPKKSMGGLLGGESQKMVALAQSQTGPCDGVLSSAAACAMAVLETNATMGRIMAAPTAGSSGVIPGVLFGLWAWKKITADQIETAIATASAVGYLITLNATVAGAEGGCQAEVGAAAAMAAAAVTEIYGGTPEQCLGAASNALMNLMGLVCDPVGGLVEAPCQKRNAAGAAIALVSAQMSLAGVGNLVRFDQMVDTMYAVGKSIPYELRETALGGMATCPDACAACEKHRLKKLKKVEKAASKKAKAEMAGETGESKEAAETESAMP